MDGGSIDVYVNLSYVINIIAIDVVRRSLASTGLWTGVKAGLVHMYRMASLYLTAWQSAQ